MTPELKREIDAMRLRNALDPKKFMKGGAKKEKIGEFFQVRPCFPPLPSSLRELMREFLGIVRLDMSLHRILELLQTIRYLPLRNDRLLRNWSRMNRRELMQRGRLRRL